MKENDEDVVHAGIVSNYPKNPGIQADFVIRQRHGSWLNEAEIEIGIFSRQCLGKRRIANLKTLGREAKAWNRRMNRDRVQVAWKFDRKTARRKFGYKSGARSWRVTPAG